MQSLRFARWISSLKFKLATIELAAALALPVIKVRTLYRILNISYDTKLTPSEAKEKFMGVI